METARPGQAKPLILKSFMERRASFDIGSGSTKVQVSDVQNGAILKTLFSVERPVAFGLDMVQSCDAFLSEEIQAKGIQAISELKQIAETFGAEKFVAVATEVFRKAKNGNSYLDRIRSMGVSVFLVTQEIEAELGFRTVVAESGENPDEACVWDSGGASFQITCRDTSSDPPILLKYMGAFGSSTSVGILQGEVRRQPVADILSINPVSHDEAAALVAAIASKLPAAPPWLLGRGAVLAAAGANSLFKLCADVLASQPAVPGASPPPIAVGFTLPQAEAALALCVGRGDGELWQYQAFENAEGPHMVVPKLALLVAVMRCARLARVCPVACIGSCPGLLVSSEYW